MEGKEEVIDLPSYEREVRVAVAPFYSTGQFLAENWQWVAATIIIPLAVWAFGHTDAGIALGKWLGVHS